MNNNNTTPDNFKVVNFAGGALAEQLDTALEEALKNILNPNTDDKVVREITLTIELKAIDESREVVKMEFQTKTKLTPELGASTNLMIGKNKEGEVESSELIGKNPNQVFIDRDSEVKQQHIRGARIVPLH